MSQTTELSVWLGEALDTAEAEAQEGSCDTWHTKECGNNPNSKIFGDCECDVPAQVLRMVAATRELLATHPRHDVTKFGDAHATVICDQCRTPFGRGMGLDRAVMTATPATRGTAVRTELEESTW